MVNSPNVLVTCIVTFSTFKVIIFITSKIFAFSSISWRRILIVLRSALHRYGIIWCSLGYSLWYDRHSLLGRRTVYLQCKGNYMTTTTGNARAWYLECCWWHLYWRVLWLYNGCHHWRPLITCDWCLDIGNHYWVYLIRYRSLNTGHHDWRFYLSRGWCLN